MKRHLSTFLLCLAVIALPVQGAAAAVMMVCGAAQALSGVSMQDRHVAMKARGEARLGDNPACPQAADASDAMQVRHMMTGAHSHESNGGMANGVLSADAVADYVSAAATADWVAEADEPVAEIAKAGASAMPVDAADTDLVAATGAMAMTASAPAHDHDTGASHGSHHHHGACGACAACPGSAMIASGLPPFLLAHHGYAAPQTAFNAIADFITSPALRPPAHC